jgi:hypothetical protein
MSTALPIIRLITVKNTAISLMIANPAPLRDSPWSGDEQWRGSCNEPRL